MQEDNVQPVQPDQFGMNQEDINNYKLKSTWSSIQHIFYVIGPGLASTLNTAIYWSVKFLKAFIGGMIRMVIKGE